MVLWQGLTIAIGPCDWTNRRGGGGSCALDDFDNFKRVQEMYESLWVYCSVVAIILRGVQSLNAPHPHQPKAVLGCHAGAQPNLQEAA